MDERGGEPNHVVPDWTHRADYIRSRSARKGSTGETDIEPEWADEAFTDPHAVAFSPDPASRKGLSDRTIGWSETAGFIITVITVPDGVKVWGANAWRSNDTDQRRYQNDAPTGRAPFDEQETTMNDKDIARRLAEVSEESELRRHDPLPEDAVGSRKGTTPAPKVLSVRLTAQQYRDLAAIAAERDLPVSTMARLAILQTIETTARPASGPIDLTAMTAALREVIRPEFLKAG